MPRALENKLRLQGDDSCAGDWRSLAGVDDTGDEVQASCRCCSCTILFACAALLYPRVNLPGGLPTVHRYNMPPIHIVFIVTVARTALSGLATVSIVVFGDTRRNIGQRNVAEKFAQIVMLGAAAIVSLLAVR